MRFALTIRAASAAVQELQTTLQPTGGAYVEHRLKCVAASCSVRAAGTWLSTWAKWSMAGCNSSSTASQ
ncbi:hypothetical protein AB0M48_32570 [Lentzea sp. NPDC051208]|uniref:hypothetical protein n=1 Tax=Lentzea sp. NPDC051208 TaxID=3154642 RepID=UPI00343A7B05